MTRLRILTVLALSACASNPPPEATVSSCAGQRIVVASNDWNQTIDVHASKGAVLGSVHPGGRQEFVLPEGVTWAYARSANLSRSRPQRVLRRFVRFRYLCQ